MSGPSDGARERTTKILDGVKIGPHAQSLLSDRIANAIQDSFDLGHKSAGGAQCDKVPAMGGFLEIAVDQEEIDALVEIIGHRGDIVGISSAVALERLLEKIELFRSKR